MMVSGGDRISFFKAIAPGRSATCDLVDGPTLRSIWSQWVMFERKEKGREKTQSYRGRIWEELGRDGMNVVKIHCMKFSKN